MVCLDPPLHEHEVLTPAHFEQFALRKLPIAYSLLSPLLELAKTQKVRHLEDASMEAG